MTASLSQFPSVAIQERSQPATPPEVKWLPLLGVLPNLLKNPFDFLARTRQQYGDIYTLNLGFAKMVVLNHPHHAQHILRDQVANYYKGGAIWEAVRPFIGNGLVLSQGEFWLRQRRLMQPQFHRQRLAGLTSLMVEQPVGVRAAPSVFDLQGSHFGLKHPILASKNDPKGYM